MAKDEIEDDLPLFVDLVNLNKADQEFLKNIKPYVKLLAGRYCDFKNRFAKVVSKFKK